MTAAEKKLTLEACAEVHELSGKLMLRNKSMSSVSRSGVVASALVAEAYVIAKMTFNDEDTITWFSEYLNSLQTSQDVQEKIADLKKAVGIPE